jgi:nucleoside-diphosphate-sugar epimerase
VRKTVIITGVTSFLGFHLAAAFAKANYRVVGTCFTPPDNLDRLRGARLDGLKKNAIETRLLDIRDPCAIHRLMESEMPDVWVQQAGIGRDFALPSYNVARANEINIEALDNIYAGLAGSGSTLILTGSGMEYGLAAPPCLEDAFCQPRSPYGTNRLQATMRARQLSARYKLRTRVARIFTVFGELDSPDRLVTRLINSLAHGRDVSIAPHTARDICDVRDVARAYVRLAEEHPGLEPFEIFNICRGSSTSLREVALVTAALLKKDKGLIREDPAMIRSDELAELSGDSGKARLKIGWSASPIMSGLGRLIEQVDREARETV